MYIFYESRLCLSWEEETVSQDMDDASIITLY